MNNMRFFRELAGLTPKQLAPMVNVSVHTYNHDEKAPNPTRTDVVLALAVLYDIHTDELTCEEIHISQDSIQKVIDLSKNDAETNKRIFAQRMFGDSTMVFNFKNVFRAKELMMKKASEQQSKIESQ